MEPYDEPEILDTDTIIRRIHPDHHVVPDENNNGYRISTKAFALSSGAKPGMSVDILKLMEDAGIDPATFVTTPIFTGSVQFPASAARQEELWVGYEPIVDDPTFPDNPYHGEVWRADLKKKFSKTQVRAMLNASQWFVAIENVQLGNEA